MYTLKIDQGTSLKAFSARLCDFIENVIRLKAEKKSFNMAHAELLNKLISTGSSRAGSIADRVMKAIPRTNLGVAMTAGKMIPAWFTA